MADFDRFRSFAERYTIERAGHFRIGFEREDAWQTLLDAKTIYGNIASQAKYADAPVMMEGAGQHPQQGPTPQSPYGGNRLVGATGPAGPVGPFTKAPATPQKITAGRPSGVSPKTWGKLLSDTYHMFAGAGMSAPPSLIEAIKDHNKNGGSGP